MRRRGLTAALVVAAVMAASPVGAVETRSPADPAALVESVAPDQVMTATPIKHFLYLMQENHSFDNYFGTYPGADGIPDGVCMPVDPNQPSGECVPSSHVGNRAVVDLPHSRKTYEAQYNGGEMNGFVAGVGGLPTGELSMAYYDDRDLPWYWNIADNYVLFDRFFSSAAAGSTANTWRSSTCVTIRASSNASSMTTSTCAASTCCG